jgi:hypothetical protein
VKKIEKMGSRSGKVSGKGVWIVGAGILDDKDEE